MTSDQSFPPPPLNTISWSAVGTAITKDNGHAECHFSAETGCWSEPTFVEDPYLRVHGLAPGLNYGMQAYEGMKAYRGPDGQIYIFRPDYHAERLSKSASTVSIPEIPPSLFLSAVNLAVARNAAYVPPHESNALLYIRPVVFASSGQLGLAPSAEFTLAVYTQPGNAYHGAKALDALVMEEFDRAAPRGTGHAKVGGNYAPVIRWSGKARAEGYGLTLHLDSRTQSEIEEFSTSGFVGVREEKEGGFTLVVPDSGNIVDSVTSNSLLALGKAQGWAVEKRKIHVSELRYFSEVLAVGTAAALLPIRSITRKSTGDKFVFQNGSVEPGPCAVQLARMLNDVQKGIAEDEFGWRVRVHDVLHIENSEHPEGETVHIGENELVKEQDVSQIVVDEPVKGPESFAEVKVAEVMIGAEA